MTSRQRLAAGAVLALAASLAAWAALRAGGAPPPAPTPPVRPPALAPTAPAAAAAPVPAPHRDVFRFADEPRVETHSRGGADLRHAREPEVQPTAEPGPRLVGLVRRGDRLVAAFAAADGEVELAGPGESAAGVVVVSIGEDSVRVRRPDGTETTLARP